MDNAFNYKQTKHVTKADETSFFQYLHQHVLDDNTQKLLKFIQQQSTIYIFSGIIRDYFINRHKKPRDIDIVLSHKIDLQSLYSNFEDIISITKNSFGGTKILINNMHIDIWTLEDTWGLIQKKLAPSPYNLAQTAFFNFSAIVYSLNEKKFYTHPCFNRFLSDRCIDILYDENPNIPLCIVNTLFYKDQLNMKLSRNLQTWFIEHYNISDDYERVQIIHWGELIYNKKHLYSFYKKCKKQINK